MGQGKGTVKEMKIEKKCDHDVFISYLGANGEKNLGLHFNFP